MTQRNRIRIVLLLGVVAVVSAAICARSSPAQPTGSTREVWQFGEVVVTVDAGASRLGAWQVELQAGAQVRFVGVEGGDHAAFAGAPFYDPRAINGGRIIVAAYSLAGELPAGATRVARVRLAWRGEVPAVTARLMAAADGDAKEIAGKVTTEVTR